MNTKKFIYLFTLCCMTIAGSVSAEDIKNEIRTITEEEKAEVGQRCLSADEDNMLRTKRAEDAQNDEEVIVEKGICAFHPNSCHYPFAHSMSGDRVELEDGSVWYVNFLDSFKVLTWNYGDLIFVKPNTSWFSTYSYMFHNQNNGDVVEVNLIAPPYVNALRIARIDYYYPAALPAGIASPVASYEPGKGLTLSVGESTIPKGAVAVVMLTDGSSWPLYGWDSTAYNNWWAGDRIIVGVNRASRFDSFPYILINVETNSYSQAQAPF